MILGGSIHFDVKPLIITACMRFRPLGDKWMQGKLIGMDGGREERGSFFYPLHIKVLETIAKWKYLLDVHFLRYRSSFTFSISYLMFCSLPPINPSPHLKCPQDTFSHPFSHTCNISLVRPVPESVQTYFMAHTGAGTGDLHQLKLHFILSCPNYGHAKNMAGLNTWFYIYQDHQKSHLSGHSSSDRYALHPIVRSHCQTPHLESLQHFTGKQSCINWFCYLKMYLWATLIGQLKGCHRFPAAWYLPLPYMSSFTERYFKCISSVHHLSAAWLTPGV